MTRSSDESLVRGIKNPRFIPRSGDTSAYPLGHHLFEVMSGANRESSGGLSGVAAAAEQSTGHHRVDRRRDAAGGERTPDELVALADRAAYRAKFSGRNSVAVPPEGDPVHEAEPVLLDALEG